jgi:putative glutamine amidotransferase
MSRPAPIIGYTLDYEEVPTYSKMPWYALRDNYMAAVAAFGAAPIGLPHEVSQVDAYLDLIDGLVVTGGNFDIPPSYYGDITQHETVMTKDRRTQFEFAITRGAIARNIPVFGICGGQQLLNVVLGGSLIQHIPDAVADALAHEQPNPRTEAGHSVSIEPDTLLSRIVGKSQIDVNSAHHQAVARVADGAVINSYAPDGVIEGIEFPAHPFCLGVQWHPEYHITPADTALFEAFVKACREYQDEK